ncbi:28441_t:CDS:2, partial [Gigaspora margarita]
MVDYCSICTEHISVYAVSQCNHRICYLCALRSRVLFKTNTCPYCRAQQNKIIFTHDSNTSFSTLLSSKDWNIIPDFQILCEDESIYQTVTNTIKLRCPLKSCKVTCDGSWHELSHHVRYRKIFSWEHQLFTKEGLKKHYRNGDGKDSNFRGHPSCVECNVTLYDLIEFREHYLMHHKNEKDVPFIIICTLSLLLSLLRMFTLPSSSNKYFASTLQLLDTYVSPLFTSILQLDLDENSQLESALHSIFISIYSIGIRVAFVIAYLTMNTQKIIESLLFFNFMNFNIHVIQKINLIRNIL